MSIFSINKNKLILVDGNYNNHEVIYKLNKLNLDTAIIYTKLNHTKLEHIYEITILEKDNSYSNMCGNGCIALCIKLKNDIILVNKLNKKIYVFYKINKIILQLSIELIEHNTYSISGEPHKVYYTKDYNETYHKKIGHSNLPNFNTTFIFNKNNNYYFVTFERGVNNITKSCGTGSFASIYFINNNINNNINKILTLENDIYSFEKNSNQYSLIYNITNHEIFNII